MMANAAGAGATPPRPRRPTCTESSAPMLKCCTRAGVHDQVRPSSIRSRDISAISRASDARARASVERWDMSGRRLRLDRRCRPPRQPGRRTRQEFHQLLHAAFQLRVMPLQHGDRILIDHDVRIDAVTFDDPVTVRIRRTELRHKYGASVEQRSAVGHAYYAAPCALADEHADFPLPEGIRENIAVGS